MDLTFRFYIEKFPTVLQVKNRAGIPVKAQRGWGRMNLWLMLVDLEKISNYYNQVRPRSRGVLAWHLLAEQVTLDDSFRRGKGRYADAMRQARDFILDVPSFLDVAKRRNRPSRRRILAAWTTDALLDEKPTQRERLERLVQSAGFPQGEYVDPPLMQIGRSEVVGTKPDKLKRIAATMVSAEKSYSQEIEACLRLANETMTKREERRAGAAR